MFSLCVWGALRLLHGKQMKTKRLSYGVGLLLMTAERWIIVEQFLGQYLYHSEGLWLLHWHSHRCHSWLCFYEPAWLKLYLNSTTLCFLLIRLLLIWCAYAVYTIKWCKCVTCFVFVQNTRLIRTLWNFIVLLLMALKRIKNSKPLFISVGLTWFYWRFHRKMSLSFFVLTFKVNVLTYWCPNILYAYLCVFKIHLV